MTPLEGRKRVNSGEKREKWPLFDRFQALDGVIFGRIQKFWQFWNRGVFLHKISTIWVFLPIWADFMGDLVRSTHFT